MSRKLLKAIDARDVAKVKALVQAGERVENGKTPAGRIFCLHQAVLGGLGSCIGDLLAAGAHLEQLDDEGLTPLQLAASEGEVDCLKALIQAGANVEVPEQIGAEMTPLQLAARYGKTDCLDVLLSAGALVDFDVMDSMLLPLVLSIKYGHEDCFKSLLKAGANVELKTSDSWSVLHCAADVPNPVFLQELLGRVSPEFIQRVSAAGDTPLHFAARSNFAEGVNALVSVGVPLNVRDDAAKTPLHWAAGLGNEASLKALLSAGALSSDLPLTVHGYKALHIAARHGHSGCVQALVDAGANIHERDSLGYTALHHAVARVRNSACAQVLIAAGANVNQQNNRGRTPLHLAVKKGFKQVKALLEAGADPLLKDKDGNTPDMLAPANALEIKAFLQQTILARSLASGLSDPERSGGARARL